MTDQKTETTYVLWLSRPHEDPIEIILTSEQGEAIEGCLSHPSAGSTVSGGIPVAPADFDISLQLFFGPKVCQHHTTEFWRLPKSQQTFIERVARAICKADGCDPDRPTHPRQVYNDDPISDVAIPEWQNFIPQAQAAIEMIDND